MPFGGPIRFYWDIFSLNSSFDPGVLNSRVIEQFCEHWVSIVGADAMVQVHVSPSVTSINGDQPLDLFSNHISVKAWPNGRRFADDILKYILLNDMFFFILVKISLKFVPMVPVHNMSALVQAMACRWACYNFDKNDIFGIIHLRMLMCQSSYPDYI